jgi:hypothetical protein
VSIVLSRSLADPRYRCDGCKLIVPLNVGIFPQGETHWCPVCAFRLGMIDRAEFERWRFWHAGRATGPRLPGIAPRRERPC